MSDEEIRHQWLVALVRRGEARAEDVRRSEGYARTDPRNIDLVSAEVRHWQRLYGRQSATIGALRDTVGRLRSERNEQRDPDQCGDPAPSLVGNFSTGWCVRRPGHGVPHRDRDGAEWVRRALRPRSARGLRMTCTCTCLDCRDGRHGGCQYGCR